MGHDFSHRHQQFFPLNTKDWALSPVPLPKSPKNKLAFSMESLETPVLEGWWPQMILLPDTIIDIFLSPPSVLFFFDNLACGVGGGWDSSKSSCIKWHIKEVFSSRCNDVFSLLPPSVVFQQSAVCLHLLQIDFSFHSGCN